MKNLKYLKSYRIYEQEIAPEYMPEESEESVIDAPVHPISQSHMSEEPIILKLQAGDYVGAKELVHQLTASAGSSSDRTLVNGRLKAVNDYLADLPEEKRMEIKQAISSSPLDPSTTTI